MSEWVRAAWKIASASAMQPEPNARPTVSRKGVGASRMTGVFHAHEKETPV